MNLPTAVRSEYRLNFQRRISRQLFISYIFELRNLAVNKHLLTPGTINRMKRSNVLLGSRRVKRSGGKASNEGDEDDWDFQDDLLQPNKIAIADDNNAYQYFGDRIFCAPPEDLLEGIIYSSDLDPSGVAHLLHRIVYLLRFSAPELLNQGRL
jgi:hypothetical protein